MQNHDERSNAAILLTARIYEWNRINHEEVQIFWISHRSESSVGINEQSNCTRQLTEV